MSRAHTRMLSVALVALFVNLAAVTYAIMQPTPTQPPVVKWEDDTYTPVAGCPGDVNSYSLKLTVSKPAILFVAVAHLRGGEIGDTIQGATLGTLFTTIIPTPRTIIDNDATWTIPDLPPGDYVRVVAAGTFSEPSQPAMRLQPYTILESCTAQE